MRLKLFQQTYLFKFRLSFFLLCLFFFILCCLLGIWQLHRYHFKQELLALSKERENTTPKSLLQITNEPNIQFEVVSATGKYLNEFTILQNRAYQGQMGYEVLTPFQPDADKNLLLIDRGWIPATQKTKIFTQVQGVRQIKGKIKLLNEYQFILGKNITPNTSPIEMQKIDLEELSQIFKKSQIFKSFYPFILRLDAKEPNGFLREWNKITFLPERHMAYAVQWFALALVLLIAYLCFCFEREGHATK